jgi:hypothetical protein
MFRRATPPVSKPVIPTSASPAEHWDQYITSPAIAAVRHYIESKPVWFESLPEIIKSVNELSRWIYGKYQTISIRPSSLAAAGLWWFFSKTTTPYSYAYISERTGISRETIKNILRRADVIEKTGE